MKKLIKFFKNKKPNKMKDQIKVGLLTNNFMLGLILALQATAEQSLDEIVDNAAQTAINEHPGLTNIPQLVEYAGNFICMQLGIPC
jgi:hypothetical protein